jgi:hypothetical protein
MFTNIEIIEHKKSEFFNPLLHFNFKIYPCIMSSISSASIGMLPIKLKGAPFS